MDVRTLIQELLEYNLDAEVSCIAHNDVEEFSITYATIDGGEGGTKQDAGSVNFYIDSLCSNDQASQTHNVNPAINPAVNPIIEVIEFDDFVEFGKSFPGVNIVNCMPWSFEYKGHPITHENDKCYIIPAGIGSIISQYFRPGDLLITDTLGNLHVIQKKRDGKRK